MAISLRRFRPRLPRGGLSGLRGVQRRQLSSAVPVVEVRESQLKCEHVDTYLQHCVETADFRRELLPLRLHTVPDVGGTLNVATQFLGFEGGQEGREHAWSEAKEDARWEAHIDQAKWAVLTERSTLFVEAPLVANFGLVGMMQDSSVADSGASTDSGCIYELRRYQLKLGYDTVPRFVDHYSRGLPSKLVAEGTDPSTSLVTVLYTEVGSLNEVIELWRHGGGTAAMDHSRRAARAAPEWREAIAAIAELAMTFTSTIHRPTACSPWQ